MSEKFIDSFELPKDATWQLDEFAKEKIVDGQFILGRVVGPMYAPGGDSLNGRHYTKQLWELAIQRNKDRLEHGDVLGCIGHDQAIDDNAMAEGKISHKVTRMWIDEKSGAGMGEIHIIGTESGKALNAMLRSGVKLQVSTRATGSLSDRKSKSGNPIIDEESYKFEGIDFVRKGGIPSASPILVEKHYEIPQSSQETTIETDSKSINDSKKQEKIRMSDTLLESLAADKLKLQDLLNTALTENKNLVVERDALRLETNNRQNEVNRIVESEKGSKGKVTELEDKLAETENKLKAYVALGEAANISEELTKTKTLLAQYSDDFGSIDQLTEAYAKVEELIAEYKPLGSPSVVAEALRKADEIADLGNVEEIKENLESFAEYTKTGTLEEVQALIELSKSYKELGTPAEIEEAFAKTQAVFDKLKSEKAKNEAVEIAKKFRVKVEKVEEMLVKNGKDYTVSFLEDFASLTESNVKDRYQVDGNSNNNPSAVELDEGNNDAPVKSRADLILERFTHRSSN